MVKRTYSKNTGREAWLPFLFILAFLCWGLYACQDSEAVLSKIQPYEGPILKAFDIETTYSDSGQVKVKVRAPLQLEYENGNQDFPKGVEIDFFNKEGERYTTLTANKAHFIRKDNLYIATGDVVVTNLEKQERLNTEELRWNPNTQEIYTDKFVTITTPEEILKGQGLNARQDFTAYKIRKPTGTFKLKK